jgi:hypothetical protein
MKVGDVLGVRLCDSLFLLDVSERTRALYKESYKRREDVRQTLSVRVISQFFQTMKEVLADVKDGLEVPKESFFIQPTQSRLVDRCDEWLAELTQQSRQLRIVRLSGRAKKKTSSRELFQGVKECIPPQKR